MSLAVVRDLRVARAPVTPEDLAALQTDVLAGFVLARAAAGLSDGTIASDVLHLEQVRAWFGRPLWDMEPADADAYFGKVLRDTAKGTRLSRAQALKTYFLFLELRHKAEIHQMTGRVVECPIDEMNRPRGRQAGQAADPADRRPGGPAVRRMARRTGDLPEVRPGRPQLHRLPAPVRGRAAGERGLQARPARHQVGPGPVRQAPRPSRQGSPRLRSPRTHGPADQQRRSDAALVRRGRVGPVRRRPHPAWGSAAAVRTQERRRDRRPGR